MALAFEDTRKVMKSFDAFPKRPSTDQVRSQRGAMSTLLSYFFMIFFLWVELGGYFDGYMDYQFSVDEKIRESVALNVDIIVSMPCIYLDANVRDYTDDRFLAEELLNFEGMSKEAAHIFTNREAKVKSNDIDTIFEASLSAEYVQKGLRTNLDFPFCRISGSLPINRVQGDFHITAEGHAYHGEKRIKKDEMNFSHYINEFSFGTFYPFIDNTLDRTSKKTEESAHTYHYSLKVVPTAYKKLGAEIDTNQYSVTFFETTDVYASGIFFKYEFDPIKMHVIEQRIPFLQFLIKVITIIGSIWIIAQWVYKAFDKFIYATFGEKYARRGEEKKGGLLDEDLDDELESI